MDSQTKELIDLMCLRGGECPSYVRFDTPYAICSHYVKGKRMGPKELPVDKLILCLGCDTYQAFLEFLPGLLEAWRRPSLGNICMNIKMHKFQQFLADNGYFSPKWLKYAFVKPFLLESGVFLHEAFITGNNRTISKAVEDNLRQAYWYFRGLYLLDKHKDSLKEKTVTIPLGSVNISNGRVIGLQGMHRDTDDLLVDRLLKYGGVYNTPVDYTQTNNLTLTLRYYYLPEDIDPEGVVSKMLVIQNSSLRAEGVYYTVILDGFDNTAYAPTLSVEAPLSICQTQKG